MMFFKNNRTKIITTVVFVAVLTIAWQIYINLGLRVTSITPNPRSTFPTSTEQIRIKFNKKLDKSMDYKSQIPLDSDLLKNIEIDGSSIIVKLGILNESQNYSITLKNIKSTGGHVLSRLDIKFTAVYVPYNKLSKDQQKIQLNNTDIGAIEEPLEKLLPRGGLGYYLTGYHSGKNGESQYTLHARITLNKADISTGRDAAIESQKNKIKDYLVSNNFDPTKYPITYEIIDPPF